MSSHSPSSLSLCPDAEDFDPEAGFQKKDDDRWEGEDAELDPEVGVATLSLILASDVSVTATGFESGGTQAHGSET